MSGFNQENRYDIMQNAKGEILIIIGSKEGGPENPRFVFDGSEIALIYRSQKSAVVLKNVAKDAVSAFKLVNEVAIVEIEDDEVIREYKVPTRFIKSVSSIID